MRRWSRVSRSVYNSTVILKSERVKKMRSKKRRMNASAKEMLGLLVSVNGNLSETLCIHIESLYRNRCLSGVKRQHVRLRRPR